MMSRPSVQVALPKGQIDHGIRRFAVRRRRRVLRLGGDLPVNRLGFGAMQLTGPGVWGEPLDPQEAIRVLRRAVDPGVNFIDTADPYGPFVGEQLIHKALHPYPEGMVIATRCGLSCSSPDGWRPLGRPE